MEKEKKKTIVLTTISIVIAAALIVVFAITTLRESGTIGTKESRELMNEFNKYYSSKERTVIYYASKDCSYCSLQTPILEVIADDYDMDYLYVDSSILSTKQRNSVLEKLGIEHLTPTTLVVEDGEVVDKKIGFTDGTEYVKFLSKNKVLPEDAVYSSEKNITFIDYSKYEKLIGKNDLSIIVIGQTTCSHCIAIKPALNEVAGDYNLTINYLNMTELTDDEKQSFYDSLDKIEYNDPDYLKDGSFGTPLILVIKDKKVLNYISGERTISQLVKEFRKIGLIEE